MSCYECLNVYDIYIFLLPKSFNCPLALVNKFNKSIVVNRFLIFYSGTRAFFHIRTERLVICCDECFHETKHLSGRWA